MVKVTLRYLANLITSRPRIIVVSIIFITIGFSMVLPTLEMKTSMEDFLPDDEVVLADDRINQYFGDSSNVIIVLVRADTAPSVISTDALKEIHVVSDIINSIDYVEATMSISSFVDIVCGLEYNKSLDECTDKEIKSAYFDLMNEPTNHSVPIHSTDDPNEKVDFQRNPFSKKLSVDIIDIKNLQITQNDTSVKFTILLYDATDIESFLMSSGLRLNVMEWFVDFQNMIGPKALQDMKYKISAHIEPKEELWDIGQGVFSNLNHLIKLVKNRELRHVFTTKTILWLQPPGQDISFPISLETGDITWDNNDNSVSILVSRKELGNYGIAFENYGFGMPARLGNFVCGVRAYQLPFLQMPWLRITYNMDFLQNRVEKLQTRPILGSICERLLSRYFNMTWNGINDLMFMMANEMNATDSLSLTQIQQMWKEIDTAPDNGVMEGSIFLKPIFLSNMKTSVLNFLSTDFNVENGADFALLMININGSIDLTTLEKVSREVTRELNGSDESFNAVTFQATGNSIIEYEITDVSMDANGIIIPLIFVVICVILFISFRKISYVVLPLIGLTFAIIWMFGTMVILGMPFMVMEVALIPMLMGLGVDYSVHLYHNYRVERGKGLNSKDAIEGSIRDIGIAMLLATITTFIAFLSFLTATMIPLRDFGVLCALGIAYVFVITLTFQATMRFIIDQRKINKKSSKQPEKNKEYGKNMRLVARVICRHPFPILLFTCFISIIMVFGMFQIKTGFAMEDFLPEENPSVAILNTLIDEFPFASQEREYILIEGDDIATVSTLEDISITIDRFSEDNFVMTNREGDPKTGSVLSVIENAVLDNSSLIEQFSLSSQGIPTTNKNVVSLFDYLYDHESYGFEIRNYLHKNDFGRYDATVIHVYTSVLGNGEDVITTMGILYDGLNEDVVDLFSDLTVTVTGENSMMHVIMNSMTNSQLVSTAICLVLAAFVLIFAYRNPVLGLITMIPVSISTLWIVGTMYFIGYSLNVMTIMITSLTIGLGITYAIHAVERFRLVAEHTGDVIGAVSETIGHTGGALLISAVTTIVGFGMLVLTPMPIEQQFGIITALTILFAFLTSIFILPPVLLFWGRYRKKHKGFIISPGDPNDKNYR